MTPGSSPQTAPLQGQPHGSPLIRKAEILSIGTELTSGANLDTNSQWLSRQLGSLGVDVGWHTTIPDDPSINLNAFRLASERAGLVVVSGGLGPTQDDLTREILAKLAGVNLVFDAASWTTIQEMFTKRNRICPERNKVQAYVPAGAEPLPNANGTAPGIWMKIGSAIFVALPGPPRELESMWHLEVVPRLARLDLVAHGLGGGCIARRSIRTFGAGESAVEEKLLDLTKRGAEPEVGITASNAIISLNISARGKTPEEARAQVVPIEATIRERLAELVFGADGETLEGVVAGLLQKLGKTVAFAESITCGMASAFLGRVPGISENLVGSLVVYQAKAKSVLLDYPAELLQRENCVGPETARYLARQVRQRLQADIGVAIVGYAGPGDGGPDKPAGLVYCCVATGLHARDHTQHWHGSRTEIQERSAMGALNQLRLVLLEISAGRAP
jgi:nicotinamide-nucleotide amidase